MNVTVPIYIESRFRVNRKRIKESVVATLEKNKVVVPTEVSIAIVGNRKMKSLNKKYRDIDKPTNVLSFPQGEGEKMPMPTDKLYLGDVIISYPVVVEEAAKYNKLIDDWVCELVEHGVTHLLGIHHK
ncbi:MAG TPA: rRNA maturation RNase YbeY [Patescibacteria group bacterium]|nr:rRNA maturation RNase YbeY [Patescibacteria group bacterium]